MANQSVWFAMLAGVALKSTVVLGTARLLVALLRNRSAAIRHLIWTAAAAAVLALPFLSLSLPALRVTAPAALSPDAAVLFRTTATARVDTAISPIRKPSSAPASVSAPWRPTWRLSFMLLWAAGSALAFAQMLIACAAMCRVRRAAKPSEDRLSAELAHELGIGRDVEVLETAEESMPMTFGILRPAVFLPSDSADWSKDRRRIVLLHELAHVRRGDVATHLLARLALILHWWNPLAWTAWREFLKERERATDDLVLQAGALASDYARHLLEVARSLHAMPVRGCVVVAMARRSQLEGRLVAILDSRVSRNAAGRASAIAAVLAGISLVAPLAAVRAQEKTAVPVDVAVTSRMAVAQKDPEMLEKPAESFIQLRKYDEAKALLESAAAIRADVSGSQSVNYGVALMKIADLERKRNHASEAESFYTKALQVLGDRPESASALMELGMRKKDSTESFDYFQRARRIDPSLAGPATMWMALIREREGKPTEAEELYRSALTMVNPESADAANTIELLSRFLNDQKREAEAKEMADRATAIRTVLYRQGTVHRSDSGVYRAGGGVSNPVLLRKLEPEYSPEARFAKYSGTVICSLVVDSEGIPQNVQIVRGIGLGLDQQAVEAIGKWKFKPGMKDGGPVPVAVNIEVNFRLL